MEDEHKEPEDEPILIEVPDDDDASQNSDNLVKIDLGSGFEHHEEEKHQEDENKISIQIGDIDHKDNVQEKQESDYVFKIPALDVYDRDRQESKSKSQKSRKRDQKDSRKGDDLSASEMVIKINDVNLVEEEAKLAEANLTNSLRKFYRLDTQKVTMNIDLQDPSKPESEENKTCIRGQAVLCFNCT